MRQSKGAHPQGGALRPITPGCVLCLLARPGSRPPRSPFPAHYVVPLHHAGPEQDPDAVANRALKEAARELERGEALTREDHHVQRGGLAAEAQVHAGAAHITWFR